MFHCQNPQAVCKHTQDGDADDKERMRMLMEEARAPGLR